MIEYIGWFLPYVVQFRYGAVYFALTIAGLGVPLPEEATIIVSGFMVATGEMEMGYTLLVCYLGVLSGDVITYLMGRYGGRWVLGTRVFRWLISRKRLAQAQYYYRQYGPRSLLAARQVPGIRFPTFFTAGMLKVSFWRFMLYDSFAALVSMPVVFFIAYTFGPRITKAVKVVSNLADVTGLVVLMLTSVVFGIVYWRHRSQQSE
ncbi:MAG: DedA family protein [bacterium]